MFNFWGKTRQGEKGGGDDYHLLCWHSLDVAAMGYWMVKHNIYGLADYFRRLGLTNIEQAAQFFAWLLCWHDIGKFARSFQQLYTNSCLSTPPGCRQYYEKVSHSTLGYWLWNTYLSEYPELLPASSLSPRKLKRVIAMWMPVTTGHHGRPPDGVRELDNFLPYDKEAARDFLAGIKPLFPQIEIPTSWDDDAGVELFKHLSWPISAAVVLADWTGSSTRFFPRVVTPMPLEKYWVQALTQAEKAVAVFPQPASISPFSGIKALFPFIKHPTPLQQKMLDLDLSTEGPQLFILEDVTGAGKTEAALLLTHRLMAAGKSQGLFFGLPTMATANAMFDRMAKTWLAFYQTDSRPSLVLAHSARGLMDRFNQSIWSGDLSGSEEPDEKHPFSQGCAAWFADSNKKTLLAEIGVGTLDQAMMAVMPFKHNNLRLLGLSNKILLADEIHAYDAYMSRILESLIEKQASDGNTTILLSATLSQQQRGKLVAAFGRGAGSRAEAPLLGYENYPWLTQVTNTEIISQHIATRKEVERSVDIGWLHCEQSCLDHIEKAASRGKCITWIRNSVDDAIRIYRQLLARGVIPAENLSLFHSRFAFYDRQRIETETVSRFGKGDCTQQRAGKVLIATQVIEQSLDIDLDEMISDLAPVDLLIQRAGRLQRHIRDRHGRMKKNGHDERDAPTLLILAPQWDDVPHEDWLSSSMRNSAYVYPDHGRLWQTQRILREQGAIRMPQSARLLIESVYGEDIDMPDGFAKTEASQKGKYYCDRAFAGQALLNFTTGYSPESNDFLPEKLSTRLAEESITLWLAKIINDDVTPYASGEHAWEMSVLRLRQSWWEKHKGEFDRLEGKLFQQWCVEQHQNMEFAIVILVSDSTACGYSADEGLIGKEIGETPGAV
ncbi:helicase Cas3 [Raoultella terrigena]|uniref:Helicase Cas3 n=1 Tax=Raoultella terrigena TaxID=577 RepID=A0A7Z9CR95_RAOTE|nr:helicase Cas3 [Raoultella terrigena]